MHATHGMNRYATTLAAAAALLLGACTGPATTTDAPTPTSSPSPTATPTPTPTPTPSPTPLPTEGAGMGDTAQCENPELGYTVDYPGEWWANERVEPEDPSLTPISACQYFAPTEVELEPNAGLPNGLAVWFDTSAEPIDPPEDEVVERRETTVDGHDAVAIETEPAPQPGFVPEDARVYRYVIELDDGEWLVVTTDDILQDDERYEETKPILDAMIETLELDR